VTAFKNGGVTVGSAWPLVPTLLKGSVPVKTTIPKEGATGWADTWMIGTGAAHPNCAMAWLKYSAQAKVQAAAAKYTQYTPSNAQSCALMGKKLCAEFHANAPASYFKSIAFWKTPITNCGNGKNDCEPYSAWQQAWTQVKG